MYEKHGVRFFDGGPQVYIIGQTQFNRPEFDRFLTDFEWAVNDNQVCGEPAENLVEAAARACYLSYGKGRSHEDNLSNLRKQNHGSVVRHSSVTLMIGGVSRGLTHELVRHGAGTAVSQVSTRYVDARELGFVVPVNFRDRRDLRTQFEDHCCDALIRYEHAVDELSLAGLPRKEARGTAREMLPIGLAQVLAFTFNIQSYRHVLKMRGSPGAAAEICELAAEMGRIALDLWPTLCEDVMLSEDHPGKTTVELDDHLS